MIEQLKHINYLIWSAPMLVILLGTHLYFTFHLKFIQKKCFKAIRLSIKGSEGAGKGFSSFGTLTTTLAATLGTGNIIGVSTAVFLGGPGAVFWCWLTGILGMATTYAECYLSFLYRVKQKDQTYIGGPMYVLEKGLHNKPLAVMYALCTCFAAFGVGCTTQSNSITEAVKDLIPVSPIVIGLVAAIIVGLVIVKGIKSIEKVCMNLVPAMGLFYLLGCFFLLIINSSYIFESLSSILICAFSTKSFAGGLVGYTMGKATRYGIARGLFTNEAGLGTAGIIAAGSHETSPKTQSLISMTATFWDTVIMCAITGIVIVTHILKYPSVLVNCSPAGLTSAAFRTIPFMGNAVLSVAIVCFAVATLIGWSYFGYQAAFYLFGNTGIKYYQIIYIIMIFIGAIMSLELVWELSDFINVFMALPNILALFLLRKKIQ